VSTGTAAVFVGTGKPFELRSYPVPDPEPGAILVRVTLANVCGSDLHMWRGELNLERLGLPLPAVLGHEAVGRIEALGDGPSTDSAGEPLAEGDRLAWRYFTPCGRCRACLAGKSRACQQVHRFISQQQSADDPPHFVGAYATHYYLRPGQIVFKVPDDLPDGSVAGANCALAEVIQGLHEVGLRPGESVVVQGAGGLGTYACAVAKAMGAALVLAVDGVPERLDLARAFGADDVLDLNEVPDSRDRVKAVRSITDGGADLVCEFVGHASAVHEGIQMVAPGGRYLECGCIHTGTTFEFDPAYLTLLSRTVHGVIYYEPWALGEALRFLDRHRDSYPWEDLLAARYPLSQIDAAFQDADARRVPRAALEMP
jgi:putative phosphonate catabolism associated alcohol dehydrogenase